MNALIRNQKKIFKYNYKIYTDIQGHNRTYKSYKHGNKSNIISGRILLLNKTPVTYSGPLSTILASNNYNTIQTLDNYEWFQHNQQYQYQYYRYFHKSLNLYDVPSSKVEASVDSIKKQQKEKEEEQLKNDIKQMLVIEKPLAPEKQTQVVKKSLKTRVWEELVHYYHGFRLFFIDLGISIKLVGRLVTGKTLSRREHKLLLQTTSDLFRLVPFSIFIIVPFLELLLPIFLKLFPGMLPSQFQTKKELQDKLKKNLAVKLEVAKFLQKTLDQMAVQHSQSHKSEEAKQFAEFFRKVKVSNQHVPADDIIKFAKKFSDDITLDSLTRQQLIALCRVLEVTSIGTTNVLRYLIRMRLRSLAADDKIISREGVSSLNYYELQTACKARGMRAYGMSEDRLRAQLEEWIQLSLNENVPSILLLLSRALMMPDDLSTSDKLKDTIRELPDTLANQTKAAIGELEGKIDNKTKIEIIREEQRKIKEENEEEQLEQKLKEEELKQKQRENDEELVDGAPVIRLCNSTAEQQSKQQDKEQKAHQLAQQTKEDKASITSKEVELITQALDKVAENKKQLLMEKETIKELKEEIQDYKEDIEELQVARTEFKADVKESRAAQLLFKKINKMIGNLDKVLTDLEKKSETIAQVPENKSDSDKHEELVRIDELVAAIKGLKKISDDTRMKTIETVLSKIDCDQDGQLKVEYIMKIIKAISNENVKLNEQQLEELCELIKKEEHLEAEVKIEKALAKSIKDTNKQNEDELLRDTAAVLKDTAKSIDNDKCTKSDKNAIISDVCNNPSITPELPKLPDTQIPPISTTTAAKKQQNSKDKLL